MQDIVYKLVPGLYNSEFRGLQENEVTVLSLLHVKICSRYNGACANTHLIWLATLSMPVSGTSHQLIQSQYTIKGFDSVLLLNYCVLHLIQNWKSHKKI